MRTLGIDIETFSEVDIKEAGAHRYIDDPSFQVMLFAYSIDGGDVQIVDLMLGESLPEEVTAAIKDDRVTKTAWNAVFERTALSKFLGVELSPKSWDCTMIRAARAGLPLSLDQCCEALKLPSDKAKMKVGKELIKFFCVPTKTTLKKGPMARKRNMPQNDFEKWRLFKDYCVRDVESEQLIRSMLMHVETTPMEKALYCLDQEINDRGVLVDLRMAQNAVNIYQARTAALMEEARALSGLDNPRSVAQLKTLFGVEALNKKTIGGVRASATEEQRRILDIRQELGKTPLKKYDVMLAAACHDDRVRGSHQFYGTRTGRWAGRLLQIQNLPQNHLEDIGTARQMLVEGDAEGLELFYGNVSDTMCQLIRTALVAKPGRRFIVCDFSAIEARVIAWLAGEEWRLDLFRKGGDIYCESASRIYGVPVEKHGRNSGLRQKGKIAELACIAEGQLVLTDHGMKRIEKVTLSDRVWDGLEFVSHEGVVYQGIKKVIRYDGIEATEDHLVYIEGQCEPVRFGDAAASGARLQKRVTGWGSIRPCGDFILREKVSTGMVCPLRLNDVQRVWEDLLAKPEQSDQGHLKRVPVMLTTFQWNPEMAAQALGISQAALLQSIRAGVSAVRSQGHPVQVQWSAGGCQVHGGDLRTAGEVDAAGQDRHEWPLRAGKPEICHKGTEPGEQEAHSADGVHPGVLALCQERGDQEAVPGHEQGADHRGSQGGRENEAEELARYSREARVYDIRNAGPRHRYTVQGRLVHNCGYGGGVGALMNFGADKVMTADEMSQIIFDWREASPNIVKLWTGLEKFFIKALEDGRPHMYRGLVFAMEKDAMTIRMPSGRKVYYQYPKIGVNRFGSRSIIFKGVDQKTHKWQDIETYGGKLTENIVQAIARDCLALTMLRLADKGYEIVFHVHDECVIEATPDQTLADVEKVFSIPMPWERGEELPLVGAGYETPYYLKD